MTVADAFMEDDKTMRIWTTSSLKSPHPMNMDGGIVVDNPQLFLVTFQTPPTVVQFHPTRQWAVVGERSGQVSVVDVESGERIFHYICSLDQWCFMSVQWNPNGHGFTIFGC